MPLYEYFCTECNKGFSRIKQFEECQHDTCGYCGSTIYRKLAIGVKVVFVSGGTGAMSNPRKSPLDK